MLTERTDGISLTELSDILALPKSAAHKLLGTLVARRFATQDPVTQHYRPTMHLVTLSPHWFHDVHAHLVAATPNARFVEFFPDDQVLNFRRLIDTQLEQKDGYLLLPQTPGLGFESMKGRSRNTRSNPANSGRL